MLLVIVSIAVISTLVSAIDHPEEFVNLLAGSFTDGNRFSTGNTLPLVGLPWGFNHWAPQTKEQNRFASSWWFNGNDHILTWLRCTHQPSPWIGDYGWFLFGPQLGAKDHNFIHFWEPRGALMKPYLFDATVAPHAMRIELAPTMHGSMVRVHFPPDHMGKYFCFANLHWDGGHSLTPIPQMIGRNTQVSQDRMVISNYGLRMKATSEGAVDIETDGDLKCFKYRDDADVVIVRIATSLISDPQAALNMERELPLSRGFDDIASEAKDTWRKVLKRVDVVDPGEVSSYNMNHLTVFYTGLWRALTFPRRIDEIDSSGKVVHYSPFDPRGGVFNGPAVTDNGFWDTFRTVYPLLSLLYPDLLGDIIEGWLNAYREGGWLPSWASPGYRNCMVGTFADVVVSDAIVKRVPGFDLETAHAALIKDGFDEPPKLSAGAVGKDGLHEYLTRGYLPTGGDGSNDAVSRTLDFGFADFSTAQAFRELATKPEFSSKAQELKDRANELESRSNKAYRSLFDPGYGLMIPKDAIGRVAPGFHDIEWGRGFTEGNSWHHSFPPYALPGLIELYGGKEKMLKRLKGILTTSGKFMFGSYGQEIHEMTEARAGAMGQYSHNNQPCHHIPYLFAQLGDRATTEMLVRQIMDRAYGIDFYAGDEDNGEMGSWLVLSALGLYSTTPGTRQYVLGSPLFKHVRILRPLAQSASDKSPAYLDIVALGTSKDTVLVDKVTLNGATVQGSTVDDFDLQKDGVLRFVMKGESSQDFIRPPSVNYLAAPAVQTPSPTLIPSRLKTIVAPQQALAAVDESAAIKDLKDKLTASEDAQRELKHRLNYLLEFKGQPLDNRGQLPDDSTATSTLLLLMLVLFIGAAFIAARAISNPSMFPAPRLVASATKSSAYSV